MLGCADTQVNAASNPSAPESSATRKLAYQCWKRRDLTLRLASSCRRVHLRSFGERNQQRCRYEPSNAGGDEPTTEASRRLDDGPHGVGIGDSEI